MDMESASLMQSVGPSDAAGIGLILLWMPMFYQQAGSDELMHDNVQRCKIKLPAERAKCGSPSFQVLCPLIPLFFFLLSTSIMFIV